MSLNLNIIFYEKSKTSIMHYVIFLKKVILIINGRDEWLDKYKDLQYAIDEITEIAKGYGLDFYPMRYEICPPEIIYTFGAYGMPTRFTHWSFGKQFHKMKLHYDLGLSKIYELVINSDPCRSEERRVGIECRF